MTGLEAVVRLQNLLKVLRALRVVVNEELALELISVGKMVVALEVIRDTLPHSLEEYPDCNREYQDLAQELGVSPGFPAPQSTE